MSHDRSLAAAILIACMLLILMLAVYAMFTGEPGAHRRPREPLYLRAGHGLAAVPGRLFLAAVYAVAFTLVLADETRLKLRARVFPAGPDNGDLPATHGQAPVLHVRPALDGHIRQTPGGGLYPVPATAPDDTLTDVMGLAIAGGSDVRAQVTA